MKPPNFLLMFMLVACAHAVAQTPFRYKRNIIGVNEEGWHKVTLPGDIFQHLNRDFADLRLFSLDGDDTLELAYLLKVENDELTEEEVELSMFNKSFRDGVTYLTFELQPSQKVNFLELAFEQSNYFGYVTLEGSDDRLQWFEIVKDQRILSIKKPDGDFSLSTIRFPLSAYRYLRIGVRSDTALKFSRASFAFNKIDSGSFRDIPLTWAERTDKKLRQSYVDLKFEEYSPVSILHLQIDHDGDYYRSFSLQYVRDSTRTEKGWVKNYYPVLDGHLTSFKSNSFDFPVTFTKEMRLTINNGDNRPLVISQMSAAGPEVTLTASLKPGNNFMMYGADVMQQPSYDLAHFQEKIPGDLPVAKLAPAEEMQVREVKRNPLFQSKLWLWSVIVFMIGGLGFFTIKMMKQK